MGFDGSGTLPALLHVWHAQRRWEPREHGVLMDISGTSTLRGQEVQKDRTQRCGKSIRKAARSNGLSTH